MPKFYELNKLNKSHRCLLNEEKKQINVLLYENKNIRWNNNSKNYKNKYKNIQNIHNIIKSSVIKNYKNIYFYKSLLKVTENRKDELSLYQINVIIQSLIQANIYNYSFFDSMKNVILKYAKNLQDLIETTQDIRKDKRKYKSKKWLNNVTDFDNNFYLKSDSTSFLAKEKRNKTFPNQKINNIRLFITDKLNILLEILHSYNSVNLNCHYFYSFLFFVLTKNSSYFKNKKYILDVWRVYLDKSLFNITTTVLQNKKDEIFFITEKGENAKKQKKTLKLYRHNCRYNLKLKTVYDHTIALKKILTHYKKRVNSSECRSKFVFLEEGLFCKNSSISIYKYIVLLLLKNENYSKCRIRQMKKDKNSYISNGYMYKLKNVNAVLNYFPVKYFIKSNYVNNPTFLKSIYFPKTLKKDLHFIQKMKDIYSKLNIKSRMLDIFFSQTKKSVDASIA